ncbi:diaphanous like protein, partial [Reticulomyxa filosa]
LKGVHWSTVEYESEDELPTVWESVHKDVARSICLDKHEIQDLFQFNDPSVPVETLTHKPSVKKETTIQLLDAKRSFNVSVGLSRMNRSDKELFRAIVEMDETALNPESIEKLIPFMPTNQELSLLRNFKGDVSRLNRPEKFFLQFIGLNDVGDRLNLWLFYTSFKDLVSNVSTKIDLVCKTLHRIKNSQSLKNILATILSIGNFINYGTNRGKAFGFKLSSIDVVCIYRYYY